MIEHLELQEAGDNCPNREVAKLFEVNRTTLARRHRSQCRPHTLAHLALHPQQEEGLVEYIKGLTERRLPPKRLMIRNFASSLAGRDVSDSWVTRFMSRNSSCLVSRWQTAMDRKRHKADSAAKYSLYFRDLHDEMKEYSVEPTHIFNMDEKGFQIGVLGRSKRVFDKVLYSQEGFRAAALQDGDTQWVTVLACVCADGTALSPSLIFQSAAGALQSSWVDAIDSEKHSVFISSSPSGWTNHDIGLAWLKEVFERETRRQARSGCRLLLLDGNGSHVTMELIIYCNDNKILLAVFPYHATHTLQPLDRTVKDQGNKDVKKLRQSLHHISAQNSILREEIRGLRVSLLVKKRQQKKSFTLQLNNPKVYHGGAVFWSPKKVRQAREDEAIRQQQAQQLQLQRAESAQVKEKA